ncbi:hypothetical protein D3C87_1961310 [compost metagenome]
MDVIQGVNVKLTSKLTIVAKATVNENCLKRSAITEFTKVIGTKTTTITSVMANAAKPISVTPSMVASQAFLPISKCRWMFSRITIESSTRIPITSESARSVIRLSE